MTAPSTLTSGAKSPLCFFPRFFFEELHDQLWLKGLGLDHLKGDTQKYRTLKKAGLEYLGEDDLKTLFFYECHHLIPYLNNSLGKLSEDDLKKRDYHLKVIHKLCIKLESRQRSSGRDFEQLALAYFHFFLALSTEGHRSRKIMRIAQGHLCQFRDLHKENHLYCHYLQSLIEVGCGEWESATATLHSAVKRYREPTLLTALCRLYIYVGMPHVAKFVAKKYHKSNHHQATKLKAA